jgi:uncharacterized protein (TIGR02186 family)
MRPLAFLAFVLTAWPALAAENLVSGLSQDTIQITSSYNGAEIVVFGAIERPVSDARPDIVVVVRGPEADIRVRRKDRVAGIWINRNRVVLRGMPSYYFAASSEPLSKTASAATLRQYGLGLDALAPHAIQGRHDPEPFRQALIRHHEKAGLYVQREGSVQFLSGTLFRVHVPLPASALRGKYTATVYLLRGGQVIDARSSNLSIDQTGFERRVFDLSRLEPFAYGLSTVLMAVFMGWLSSLAFRRSE